MQGYYLNTFVSKSRHAGSKAVSDCEQIMDGLGFEKVSFPKLLTLPEGALLVVRHPIYGDVNTWERLKQIKPVKRLTLVSLVHDLESLRQMKFRQNLSELLDVDADADMLQNADYIIAHNPQMQAYLVSDRGVAEDKIVSLGIFDYLVDEDYGAAHPRQSPPAGERSVVVAGNLSPNKSAYIYDLMDALPEDIILRLYGTHFDPLRSVRGLAAYQGSYPADTLPFELDGRFGIVWDGDSLDGCTGNTGNYLRYNDPHKFSLYVAAEIPVIIWKEAALAGFVESEGIGLAVDSLRDLDAVFDGVTEDQYAYFKANLHRLAQRVRSGWFLTRALEEVERRAQSAGA